MNGKKENGGPNRSSQVVTATDTFAASDYLLDNSMDNVEGMLRLLMNNNLAVCKCSDDSTQSRLTAKAITAIEPKLQQREPSAIRGLSADSVIRRNQQFTQHSMKDLKNSGNIESQITSSSFATPNVIIVGPIRVQTAEKIDGRSMDKLFIAEMLELYGSGVKYASKELISVKPKILKSLPTSPRNIPITVQTVWVGKDYVRIDRKIEIDRSKMKFRPPPSAAMKTKEAIKFDGTEQIQKNPEKKQIWKSKSEAAILRTPVFNLIGPLIITAFQNAILDDSDGCYKIYEQIELRTDGSTAKPEIAIVPFLRKVTVLPKNKKKQRPMRYQEDILIGSNVMLINRLIEIKPQINEQLYEFSLNEERSYVTDETVCASSNTTKSMISNAIGKCKMLVLQDPPVRTDFTIKSSSSAEQVANQSARNSKRDVNLRTAIDSSEITDEGPSIVKTFDKFQVVRHSASTNNRPKMSGSEKKRNYRRLKASKSPTEAFMNANLQIRHPSYDILKAKSTGTKRDMLHATSDSLHTGKRISLENVLEKASRSRMNNSTALSTAGSITTARSPVRIRSSHSLLCSTTPVPSSGVRTELRWNSGDSEQVNVLTARLPEGLKPFSSPTYVRNSVPSLDKEKRNNWKRVPSNLSTSYDESQRSDATDLLSDYQMSSAVSITRKISEIKLAGIPSRHPEISKQILKSDKNSKRDKRDRSIQISGKHPETRSVEIPSHRSLSNVQQSRSSTMSPTGTQQRDPEFRPLDEMQKSERTSFSTASENNRSLSQKRKYGLLLPTSSMIALSPKQSCPQAYSEENLSAQSSSESEEELSDFHSKAKVTSNGTSEHFRSRFQRFTEHARPVKSGVETNLVQHSRSSRFKVRKLSKSSTRRPRAKQVCSVTAVTQASDDTKSTTVRSPKKWFEKFMDEQQSGLEPHVQKANIVVPLTSGMSTLSNSNLSMIQQLSATKPEIMTKSFSSVPRKFGKKEFELDQPKGTSIMIQSRDDENLTIELNINLKAKNQEGQLIDDLKPERVLVKGREVYRKSDNQ